MRLASGGRLDHGRQGGVGAELNRLDRPLSQMLACDNEPEFFGKALLFRTQDSEVRQHFIQPGAQTQNLIVESSNGKFQEYCLDLHWFANLEDARAIIGD